MNGEFTKPGSKLAKSKTRLMVGLMFSRKNVIIFFGSGGASALNIFDVSFFYELVKHRPLKCIFLHGKRFKINSIYVIINYRVA